MSDGSETEQRCMSLLDDHGFETWTPPKAKYRGQDVFGIYDVLAFGHDRLLLIQVKGGRDASGINDYMAAMRTHDEQLADCQPQLWHQKDKRWRIAEPEPGGYSWVFDARREDHIAERLEAVVVGQ